ncbi:MAG: DUF86 domain-containing protein [Moorellales bacterium]
MKKDDRVYLQHVVEAIGRIQDYLAEVSKEQFPQTSLLQDAAIRRLEIIGEADTLKYCCAVTSALTDET